MKMLQLGILVFLFNVFFCNRGLSQEFNLHIVIFAATEDPYLGIGAKISLSTLKNAMTSVESIGSNNVNIKYHIYEGINFTLKALDRAIVDLENTVLDDDVVLFYFVGNGYSSEHSSTPNLLFHSMQSSLTEDLVLNHSANLEKVHKRLKNLDARLTISIADASNTEFRTFNPSAQTSAKSYPKTQFPYLSPFNSIHLRNFLKLFKEFEGEILINSSKREESSIMSDKDGGLFTHCFSETLIESIESSSPADWSTIQNTIERKLLKYSHNLTDKQLSQFPIFQVFPKKQTNKQPPKEYRPLNTEINNRPTFPNPAPLPTSHTTLPIHKIVGNLPSDSTTLGVINDQLVLALNRAGYNQQNYFSLIDQGGFAFITKMERFDPETGLTDWTKRYIVGWDRINWKKIKSFREFINAVSKKLFNDQPGHFRIMAFVIAEDLEWKSNETDPESQIFRIKGNIQLFKELKNKKILNSDYSCFVLIYEYRNSPVKKGEYILIKPIESPLTGEEHLGNAGILNTLKN